MKRPEDTPPMASLESSPTTRGLIFRFEKYVLPTHINVYVALFHIAACNFNGQTYEDGSTFPSLDGCNTCSCLQGEVINCGSAECRK